MPYLQSSCSDEGLHQYQLRSLSISWRNHPWSSGAQRQHCPLATVLFFPNIKLVSAATTSSSIALTIPLVELCGIKCTTTMPNFVEFRWRNLRQSMIIPEPYQIWTGIWTSLGRGIQSLARRSFGRSNRSSTANSHIYHSSKFQLDPTVQTPRTFR